LKGGALGAGVDKNMAQAKAEGLTLMSDERLCDAFGVDRLW
jgi:hypothetical protein